MKQLEKPRVGEEVAIINTNLGDIKLRLFPEIAPKAVENFKTHSKNGYYDGVIFHRVIKDFMIQTGDPTGTGMGGESIWKSNFEDEFNENYRNLRGALSMANAGPNTNGSQFFIVQKKDVSKDMLTGIDNDRLVEKYLEIGGTPWLDGSHTVFGQVYEGMDIVDEIAEVEVGFKDKPMEDVMIKSILIEEI